MAERTLHVPRLASTFLVWRSSVELKVVWMGPSNCIVSEFYAHCDVITHHLKMEASWNPIISSSVATCQHACRIPGPRAVQHTSLGWIILQCNALYQSFYCSFDFDFPL